MDIEKFSQRVIDTYQKNPTERNRVVYTHATYAEGDTKGQVPLTKAANVATKAIAQYDSYRAKGVNHEVARDFAAKDVRDRFDENGRDTSRNQPRQRSSGMSL
jgi:hypothetical protein